MDDWVRTLPQRGGKLADPAVFPEAQKSAWNAAFETVFGTPASPQVAGADVTTVSVLAIDNQTLANGSRLYRTRCADCHGLSGNGRGPTAANIEPRPRDFRSGIYKGKTTGPETGKPRVDDLIRVLRRGVPGTPMPIFDLLPEADIRALVGYTIHLSVRGEVEMRLLRRVLCDEEYEYPTDMVAAVRKETHEVLGAWMSAQSTSMTIAYSEPKTGDEAAIRRGYVIFTTTGNCIGCHEQYGKRDAYRYDAWGLPNRVTDLTEPRYRWGSEPADFARRIRHGIRGANMPANPGLSDDQLRDLIEFLQALPYSERLPEDVRSAVDAARH